MELICTEFLRRNLAVELAALAARRASEPFEMIHACISMSLSFLSFFRCAKMLSALLQWRHRFIKD